MEAPQKFSLPTLDSKIMRTFIHNFVKARTQYKWFEGFPKMKQLLEYKNAVNSKRAHPSMHMSLDYTSSDLTKLGKFDVIYMDLPLDEYYEQLSLDGCESVNYSIKQKLRPQGVQDIDELIENLPIKQISESQAFLFMWVGSGQYLEKGRELLKKWGYRRCEDIVWLKTCADPSDGSIIDHYVPNNDELVYDQPDRVCKRVKQHCLVGIKGTVRRVDDTHFIHTNIDTDVIIDDQKSPFWSTEKPNEIFDIIERF